MAFGASYCRRLPTATKTVNKAKLEVGRGLGTTTVGTARISTRLVLRKKQNKYSDTKICPLIDIHLLCPFLILCQGQRCIGGERTLALIRAYRPLAALRLSLAFVNIPSRFALALSLYRVYVKSFGKFFILLKLSLLSGAGEPSRRTPWSLCIAPPRSHSYRLHSLMIVDEVPGLVDRLRFFARLF